MPSELRDRHGHADIGSCGYAAKSDNTGGNPDPRPLHGGLRPLKKAREAKREAPGHPSSKIDGQVTVRLRWRLKPLAAQPDSQ
ncbi:MAG: hypothetical protein ACRD1L_07535 [Terriglobales bacterium]